MTRRLDDYTAEKVAVALLTRAAFGEGTAYTYAELAGIPSRLINDVLERPVGRLREYSTMLLPPPDRRNGSRA
jgi:hypothetical protein